MCSVNRRMDEWVSDQKFDMETFYTDEMDPEFDVRSTLDSGTDD